MRTRLDVMFAMDLARGAQTSWRATGALTAVAEVTLAAPATVGIIDLREPIEHGQAVAAYRVEGRTDAGWRVLAEGTTIGYRRLLPITPTRIAAIRVVVGDAVGAPREMKVGCYAPAGG